MSDRFHIRAAEPADTAEIESLSALSADGGAVSYRVHTHVQHPSSALTRSLGVVAVDEYDGRVVGSARMTLGHCWYEGEQRPYALLGSLVVHPAQRRRGIAAALARWRIDQSEQIAGSEVAVLADIQRGNTGSLAAAQRWARAFTTPSLTVPVPVTTTQPRPTRGLEIRAAVPSDVTEVAARVTELTAAYNFARIWTPKTLQEWLHWSPVEVPIHHYRLAVSPTGAVLAGLALREEGLLRTMEVVHMPAAIRLANAVLHVVPKDRMLRNLAVEHFWSLPGQDQAAAALWHDTRWSLRDHGSNLLITLDRRNPVFAALGVRPWTPTTSVTIAVRADPPPSPDRLVAPPE